MIENPSTTSLQHSVGHSPVSSSSASPRAPQQRYEESNGSSQSSPLQCSPRQPQQGSAYIAPPQSSLNTANNPHIIVNPNNINHSVSDGYHDSTPHGYSTTHLTSSNMSGDVYPIPSSPYTPSRTSYPVPQGSPTSSRLQYTVPHSPVPSPTPSYRTPYPVPQEPFAKNENSYPIPMNEPRHQSIDCELKDSVDTVDTQNHVTVISGSKLSYHDGKAKTKSTPRWKILLVLIVLIAIGVGVGVTVSKNNKDKSESQAESNNPNNTSYSTTTTTTTTTTKSTQSTPTQTLPPIPTASNPAPTTTPKPTKVYPPPLPPLPPASCFDCFDYRHAYEGACAADADYKVCADPCNGEFHCVHGCMSKNECFQAGSLNENKCFTSCNKQ